MINEVLFGDNSETIIFNRNLAHLLGLEASCLYGGILNIAVYQAEYDEEGYFPVSQLLLQITTSFSGRVQRKLLKILEDHNLIKVKLKGMPHKRYIKLVMNEENVKTHFAKGIAAMEKIGEEMKSKEGHSKKGYVYFLQSKLNPTHIKIGMTRNLRNRINQLKGSLPFKSELIHYIICDHPYEVEQMFHERYKYKEIQGEWFCLTDEDMEDIKRLDLTLLQKGVK